MSMLICPKCGRQVRRLDRPCRHCGPWAVMAQPDDSDETEGRKLYRAKADALASAQVNIARRKVRMDKETR